MREALFEIYTSTQVEFNPYIYTLSKLSRFGYEISGAAGSYVALDASWKNGCQNFTYVYRSRKH